MTAKPKQQDSTVVWEIKAHRYDKLEWSCRFVGQNWCLKRSVCGVFGVCKGGNGCSGRCGRCRLCKRCCESFEPERCRGHYHGAPHVCNNCAYVDRCAHMHSCYSVERADRLAHEAWGEAHAGAVVTRDELRRYDEMIKEGLGYLNDGRFARSRRGDQPRACMISPRKRKAKEHMVDRHWHENRRFEDFVDLLMTDEEAIGRVAEMDTLEGRKGGKVISLTLRSRLSSAPSRRARGILVGVLV